MINTIALNPCRGAPTLTCVFVILDILVPCVTIWTNAFLVYTTVSIFALTLLLASLVTVTQDISWPAMVLTALVWQAYFVFPLCSCNEGYIHII